MYFWRIEKLKDRLSRSPLSQREELSYLLAWIIMYQLAFFPQGILPNAWDYGYWALALIVPIPGTFYLYRRNGGAAGRHFLQRYLALGWVLALRLLPVMLAAIVVFLVTWYALPIPHPEVPEGSGMHPSAVGATLLFMIVFYHRLGTHFAQVAARFDANERDSHENA